MSKLKQENLRLKIILEELIRKANSNVHESEDRLYDFVLEIVEELPKKLENDEIVIMDFYADCVRLVR
jgi:hypothetical protein